MFNLLSHRIECNNNINVCMNEYLLVENQSRDDEPTLTRTRKIWNRLVVHFPVSSFIYIRFPDIFICIWFSCKNNVRCVSGINHCPLLVFLLHFFLLFFSSENTFLLAVNFFDCQWGHPVWVARFPVAASHSLARFCTQTSWLACSDNTGARVQNRIFIPFH